MNARLKDYSFQGEIIIEAEKKDKQVYIELEHLFKYLGLAILVLFLLELLFKIAFLPKEFFDSKLEIFDATVILVSFLIDITFLIIEGPTALLFISALRLWRLTRITNGKFLLFKLNETFF